MVLCMIQEEGKEKEVVRIGGAVYPYPLPKYPPEFHNGDPVGSAMCMDLGE
jgi:hypothetical protein